MSGLLPTIAYTAAATGSYVAPLYYFNPPKGDRDDLNVVKARFKRIASVTLGNAILAPLAMRYFLHTTNSLGKAVGYLGFGIHLHTFVDSLRVLLLFCGLFIGPIIDKTVQDFLNSRDRMRRRATEPPEPFIYKFRDTIFAPITEEIIFTSIACGMFSPLVEKNPDWRDQVIILTPFLFGIAHLHHGIEMFHEGHEINAIMLTVIFQLIYTTFFGVLTNLVFENSKSVWCCIAAHAFCNSFGVPPMSIDTPNPIRKWGYWLMLAFGIWFFRTRFDAMTLTGA